MSLNFTTLPADVTANDCATTTFHPDTFDFTSDFTSSRPTLPVTLPDSSIRALCFTPFRCGSRC